MIIDYKGVNFTRKITEQIQYIELITEQSCFLEKKLALNLDNIITNYVFFFLAGSLNLINIKYKNKHVSIR